MIEILDHSRLRQKWVLMDDRVIEYIRWAGVFTLSKLRWVRPDWPLLITLIDIWMPEMAMFHLQVGEMTVTLQDVAVLLGLRIVIHLLLCNAPPKTLLQLIYAE